MRTGLRIILITLGVLLFLVAIAWFAVEATDEKLSSAQKILVGFFWIAGGGWCFVAAFRKKTKEKQNKEAAQRVFKQIAQTEKVYKNVSYKGGFPETEKTPEKREAMHIVATNDGVLFFDTITFYKVTIPWACLVSIECSSQMDSGDQAFLTGVAARSRTAGAIMAVSAMAGLGDRPLVFRFKQSPTDDFVYEAILNDGRHREIKSHIMTTRAKFFPGGLPSPADGDPSQRQSDIPELIKKLADLKEQGHLTEQEFNIKKKQLLEKI